MSLYCYPFVDAKGCLYCKVCTARPVIRNDDYKIVMLADLCRSPSCIGFIPISFDLRSVHAVCWVLQYILDV